MSSFTAAFRTVASALTWAVMAVAVIAVGAIQVVPWALGGTSMVVLTGSMEPTLRPGDVIAVKAADPAEVKVGDIVTFQPVSNDPTLITHRVIAKGVGKDGVATFTTRGDANDADDEPIVAGQLKGAFLYRIPALGWGLNALGGPGSGPTKIAAVVLIGAAGWMLAAPRRRPRRADRASAGSADADSAPAVTEAGERRPVAIGERG